MIYTQDINQWTEEYDGEIFDAVLCDPPYELGFMGKKWDSSGVAFNPETWRGIYNHLEPGAFLLAFGGTRTFHRLMVAIEDAGFEIRDVIMYVYGTGFPKSYNISKGIDSHLEQERRVIGKRKHPTLTDTSKIEEQANAAHGNNTWKREWDITAPATDLAQQWDSYGTALKPAYEPVVVAMKPLDSTYVNNAIEYGVAGLNIDGCRITAQQDYFNSGWGERFGESSMPNMGNHQTRPWVQEAIQNNIPVKNSVAHKNGRWPANLIHDGSPEVLSQFPNTKSGDVSPDGFKGKYTANVYGKYANNQIDPATVYADEGSAARFFYTSKTSTKERNAGLPDGMVNNHPTVKPISLCEYLARLILPPKRDTPRRILVPFSGSGSERIGAMLAGWDEVVGVEQSAEYANIDKVRFDWWKNQVALHGNDIDRILKQPNPPKKTETKMKLNSLFGD